MVQPDKGLVYWLHGNMDTDIVKNRTLTYEAMKDNWGTKCPTLEETYTSH